MTIEDLQETAALARLDLDENEQAALFPAFEQMLEYFDLMQTAEEDAQAFPEGLPSLPPQTVSPGWFRPDRADSLPHNEKLLDGAGEREGRFVVVPSVRNT